MALEALTLITTDSVPNKPIVGLAGITFLFEGGLAIKVTDRRGRSLSGVSIQIENPDTGVPTMGFTDSNGNIVLDVDTSNPNPITVQKENAFVFVDYTGGVSLTIILDPPPHK